MTTGYFFLLLLNPEKLLTGEWGVGTLPCYDSVPGLVFSAVQKSRPDIIIIARFFSLKCLLQPLGAIHKVSMHCWEPWFSFFQGNRCYLWNLLYFMWKITRESENNEAQFARNVSCSCLTETNEANPRILCPWRIPSKTVVTFNLWRQKNQENDHSEQNLRFLSFQWSRAARHTLTWYTSPEK